MTEDPKMLRGIINHHRSTITAALDQLGVNYNPEASTTVLLEELVTEAKALHQMVQEAGG